MLDFNHPAHYAIANAPYAGYNLRFPGQYFDVETGLFYNYFRSYDPKVGRYTQSDPVGIQGGLNTYGYVGGNPVNGVDPLGLSSTTDAICEEICKAEGTEVLHCVSVPNPLTGNTHVFCKCAKKTYYSKSKKKDAYDRAKGECEYCGKNTQQHTPYKYDSAEGDHFIPQSRGGKTVDENQVNSCRECNGPGNKGNKMPGSEWQPSNPNDRVQDMMNDILKGTP